MSCDVGEVTERLENEQSAAHSPTFQSLHLERDLSSGSWRFAGFGSM